MRSWAYAISPHGLGLSSEESWALTPREFDALRDVHKQALNGFHKPKTTSNQETIANAKKLVRIMKGELDAPFPNWYNELQANRAKEQVN